MAWFQNITVVLKFLPLLLVGTLGWFFVDAGNFGPFNASGGSLYDAINLAAGVALFSFIGVECASIAAGRVQEPAPQRRPGVGDRHRRQRPALRGGDRRGHGPRAPRRSSSSDGAPFVAAFDAMFNGAGWVGKLVALTAVISGLGALNGWTMVTAEMPYAAAKDGLFLHAFAKENRNGVPWFGIVVSTVVASLLMAWSYSGETGLKVFTYLVYLSVVTVAIPYFLSACAQLAYLVSRRRRRPGLGARPGPGRRGRRCGCSRSG